MVEGVTPNLAAVARSIVKFTPKPFCCKSLATSASAGDCRSRRTSCGVHCWNSEPRGFSSTNLYCARVTLASIVKSCTGCMYSAAPATLAVSCLSLRMIWLAERSR